MWAGASQMRRHLHLQLSNGDAAVFRGEMVAIAPNAADKLGALDDNLGQLDALGSGNAAGDDVDAGVEAKDEAGVVPVGDEVAAGQQHLARGGHGGRRVFGLDGHCVGLEIETGVDCLCGIPNAVWWDTNADAGHGGTREQHNG